MPLNYIDWRREIWRRTLCICIGTSRTRDDNEDKSHLLVLETVEMDVRNPKLGELSGRTLNQGWGQAAVVRAARLWPSALGDKRGSGSCPWHCLVGDPGKEIAWHLSVLTQAKIPKEETDHEIPGHWIWGWINGLTALSMSRAQEGQQLPYL